MFIWKNFLKKVLSVLGFALILTACAGSGRARPLPTPEPSAVPTDDLPEEADPGPSVVPENGLPDEAGPTRIPADKYADLEIVTLLPRDAIPAIDDPQFLAADAADDFYDADELVIGVVFDGDARAYSIPYLSNREIVNDMVGGVKIAVTW